MSNSTYLIVLIALLVVWILFGKRILAMFLLSRAGQGALKDIGHKAMEKQPDWIRLERVAAPGWSDPAAIIEWTKPLIAGGFQDAGVFTVDNPAPKPEDGLRNVFAQGTVQLHTS